MQRMSLIWARVAIGVAVLALASAAPAATYTWTGGGGANTSWSNPSNWGGTAPANGETNAELIFPALAGHYASNNDRNGLVVTSLDLTTQLSGGTYAFTGNSIGLNGPVTMASPGSGNPNLVWQIPLAIAADVTIGTSGRQTRLQGPIDLGSHTLTLDAEGDVVLAGVVSGSGNLVKDNSSALTITGQNTYTGTTTGNRGALYIDSAAAFGSAAAGTTFNGGFLGFAGTTFTTAEPFVFNGGGIIAYGMPTMTGEIDLDTTINVQPFEAATRLTISGSITGDGGLNKRGPGLLILNAPADSYAGDTAVDGGILQLDTALSSQSPVTVKSGATLRGNGSCGGTISVHDGGTLAPGASPGGLSSAGLSMAAGAIFAAELSGPTAVAEYDQLSVNGAVSLSGATLAVALGYAPLDGQQFAVIAQPPGQPASGSFAGLSEGATVLVGGTTFGITYRGGAGGDVVLVAGATPAPTNPSSPTPTATPTPPSTATPTGTASVPGIPSFTPTPTATPVTPPCTGDCDGSGSVAVNELVLGVNIALDSAALALCPSFDADRNERVEIPELIQAVGNALTGCPETSGVGSGGKPSQAG